jgi:hypothetical protein
MVRHTDADGDELTKVPVDRLTRHEKRTVIPDCDFIVVGYDSSYSDDDVTTKRLNDPVRPSDPFDSRARRLSGWVIGTDAEADRYIGVGGAVHTSESSGRIGTTEWVAYPDASVDKVDATVTFRCLAGNYATAYDIDEVVDDATEHTVDKYSYDDAQSPPQDERHVEDVQVSTDRTERRARIDVPVTVTVVPGRAGDIVERARSKLNSTSRGSYDTAMWQSNLPAVGDDDNKIERQHNTTIVRKNVRYWIQSVDVTIEPSGDN